MRRRCGTALAAGLVAAVGAAASEPAAAQSAAQSTVPFGPGVIYNYVMHNFDHPQDWQFFTTVASVSPDETVYTEDVVIPDTNGKPHKFLWRRAVSRREAAFGKIIDNGTTCNPGDTTDAWHRGGPLRMASQRTYRELKTEGSAEVTIYVHYGCSKPYTVTGTVTRDKELVKIPILLNGQRLDLQAIHAQGILGGFGGQYAEQFWILDDSIRPWVIRQEGKHEGQHYLQQLGTILAPDPEQEKKLEQELEKDCRAPVYGIYFESASAEVNAVSRPTLQQIAAVMQRHADWTLTIEGHTDSIGGAASNLDLSNRRAAAVKTELTSRFAVPAARLATKGYGLTRPVETNATIEGRARNRRVELTRVCK
ncbi:MAG: OmpA family protein [Gemmatimonadota bacterium]|jgi:outer membrane protein OmpA-like peptidoglycan-associated protein